MVSAYEKVIKSLWKGRCTVTIRSYKEDPDTLTMVATYKTPIVDEPCRLSFQTISPTSEGVAATVSQEVKLFVGNHLDVPTGSKITVSQNGITWDYERSGLSAVYSVHQEIPLELFTKWG